MLNDFVCKDLLSFASYITSSRLFDIFSLSELHSVYSAHQCLQFKLVSTVKIIRALNKQYPQNAASCSRHMDRFSYRDYIVLPYSKTVTENIHNFKLTLMLSESSVSSSNTIRQLNSLDDDGIPVTSAELGLLAADRSFF